MPEFTDRASDTRLVCEECGAESDAEARGWRALLRLEFDFTDVSLVFCPACAKREFGQARPADKNGL